MSKVIVPPFNKDEVKEIVNEGLKEGSIKVDGGTKLYLHELTMSDSALKVITTGSASFKVQGGPPVPTTTDNIVCVYGSGQGIIPCFTKNTVISYQYYANNEMSYVNLAGVTISSDTVTEL